MNFANGTPLGQSRGVQLPGVDAYPTLSAQGNRFEKFSYNKALALSLKTVRQHYVPRPELSRYVVSLLSLLGLCVMNFCIYHQDCCVGDVGRGGGA
jgi:hypothetical protein